MKITVTLFLLILTACSYADSTEVIKRQQVAQMSIDVAELQPYFHIDVFPERVPLIIVDNSYVKGLRLKKFNRDVIFLQKETVVAQKKPYLEFSRLDINENEASVSIIYPPEGIMVHLKYQRSGQEWNLTDSRIVER